MFDYSLLFHALFLLFMSLSKSWGLFVALAYISAMYFPRVVQEGMFIDGLCYASIARNMSMGIGSMWEPYFSSTFWLPYNHTSVFYEHPPLHFWIESLFFKVFQDHWYVEKIFTTIVLFWNLLGMATLWRVFFEKARDVQQLYWIPLILYYTFPIILRATPFHLLDSTMSVFSIWGSIYLLKGLTRPSYQYMYSFVGSILIVCAFLSKGFVGTFPLAIPCIFYWVYGSAKHSKKTSFLSILLPFFICMLTMAFLLCFVQPRSFFTQYFVQQVLSAMEGKRELAEGWANRMSIIKFIVIELAPISMLLYVLFRLYKWREKKFVYVSTYQKDACFFLFVGLSGSLPILLSSKQTEHYLIPCLPFFAIFIAILSLPFLRAWVEWIESKKVTRAIAATAIGLLVGIFFYATFLWGRPGRDKAVLSDVKKALKLIPIGSQIGVSKPILQSAVAQVYFQRYGHYELSTQLAKKDIRFALSNTESSLTYLDSLHNKNFVAIPIDTKEYAFYQKK